MGRGGRFGSARGVNKALSRIGGRKRERRSEEGETEGKGKGGGGETGSSF